MRFAQVDPDEPGRRRSVFLLAQAGARAMVRRMIAPLVDRAPPAGDPLPEACELKTAIGRILAWYLEGERLSQVGTRVLVSIHKLNPSLVGGISFDAIAAQAGYGRSAAHNLSLSFEETFPVGQTRLSRSARARAHYREGQSYRRNGQVPAGDQTRETAFRG